MEVIISDNKRISISAQGLDKSALQSREVKTMVDKCQADYILVRSVTTI